ncbi:MAG: hypothetical protein OXE99_04370 [Cellvibrionales bacterium]|nr:hypothetical protein [Cellvibrionales bacterium]
MKFINSFAQTLGLIILSSYFSMVASASSCVNNRLTVEKGNIINTVIRAADHNHKDVVLVHGCNCKRAMGALAAEVGRSFPAAVIADNKTPNSDHKKLGTYSHAEVYTRKGNRLVIVNAYTQFNAGLVSNTSELEATIAKVFKKIAEDFPPEEFIIYYPQVGAGVAGGNWLYIHQHINEALKHHERVLVEFDNSPVNTQLLKNVAYTATKPN